MAFSGRAETRRGLCLLAALAASVHVALSAGGLGDYPGDGGPALSALLHGDLRAFSTSEPAMGVFSLLLRLPFAALAYLGSPTELSIYRWGAVPCVASLALLGVWLAEIAGSRGTRLPGQIGIIALAVFNPFVQSALALGHPEELLTASLAIAAVVAAAQQRAILTVALLGLALASKQWAVIVVLPVLVALERHRLRTLASSAAIAATITLLAVVGSPGAFLDNQLALIHEHFLEPSAESWLYPLAPRTTLQLPGGLVHRGPHLSAMLVGLLHPLIIAVAVAIAAYLARRAHPRLSLDHLFAAVALMFLLRCTMDTETMPYYHAPIFATLLAWDAMSGSGLPLRGLAGVAVAYALFDRLTPSVIGPDAASWLYTLVTLVVAFTFSLSLRRPPQQSERPAPLLGSAPERPTLTREACASEHRRRRATTPGSAAGGTNHWP